MPSHRPLKGASSPRVKVQVTQDHIDTSVPKNSGHCMIADAVQDARPDARFIAVDLATIRFSEGGRRYVYLTPRKAQSKLLEYDAGKMTGPFDFRIEDAQVLQSGGQKRGGTKLVTNHKGGGTIPVRVGGQAPPTGPLAGAARSDGRPAESVRNLKTGQRREFGLRSMGADRFAS